ncbi:chemotaxis protein CheW [Aromatoleum toluclasticum]|uniref:chemotaxis protein CheW n=1 Tax=Aromatoleum toluclasticum TaxID=92003 RepID=UPI000367E3A2|nr:chemotaxis protein CheW [Aromatoleum toluclasticum]
MPEPLVVFTLVGARYAVPLSRVERVVRAVEITRLPAAPEIVLGIINVHGCVMPVVDTRKRFGLPQRSIGPQDQFIIAHTMRRIVALVVDSAVDVMPCDPAQRVAAEHILPEFAQLAGVVKLADGMILVHDLDGFLSLDEEHALDEAMGAAGGMP